MERYHTAYTHQGPENTFDRATVAGSMLPQLRWRNLERATTDLTIGLSGAKDCGTVSQQEKTKYLNQLSAARKHIDNIATEN